MGFQVEMRPSVLVVATQGAEGPRGWRRVRLTDRLVAGRPVMVSRTWQVMGSFCGGGEVMVVREGGLLFGRL